MTPESGPAPGAADRGFDLHPRLAADTFSVGDLPVSRLLVMNDQRYPWCILVPRGAALGELHDVPVAWRAGLYEEIAAVSRALLDLGGARVNVAALGNLVPQLHVHVVARRRGDAAWPGPVWGYGFAEPYPDDELAALARRLRARLVPPVPPVGRGG